MKILKFGGTSIGTANKIKNVASLINNDEEKIVVLSAMSGTTNTLYEISEKLEKKENQSANKLVDKLEEKYRKVVQELFKSTEFKNIGFELIKYHFDYIRSFMIDDFTVKEKRTILAQGELISSALFITISWNRRYTLNSYPRLTLCELTITLSLIIII